MYKVCSDKLKATMFSGNFKQNVRELIDTDKTFRFMGCMKGTQLPRKTYF